MSGRTDPNQLTKALHTVTVVKRVATHIYTTDQTPVSLLAAALDVLGYDYSQAQLSADKTTDPTIAACLEACKRIVKGEGK